MNKQKKKFIAKLKKKSQSELIDIVCQLFEENYVQKKDIHYLKNLVMSHQITLKFALNTQKNQFISYELESEDEEEVVSDDIKKSYT
jgi:hypothetical protein